VTGDLTGQFGVSRIGGRLGWWIGLGQYLCGDGAPISHAFVVVNDQVVEAMPSGARLAPLAQYLGRDDVYFSRMDLTEEQRYAIAEHALHLVGTPYGFMDYVALALNVWGVRPKWLRDYIASSDRLICSALVDRALTLAGIHMFDGKDYGAVTPGDLFRWLAVHGSQRPQLTTEGDRT
jgi:uncharacterized protein YycO